MSLELPVFNLKNLKRSFWSFFLINFFITIGSLLVVAAFDIAGYKLLDKVNTFLLFLMLLISSWFYNRRSKQDLKKINKMPELDDQIPMYEAFYKKRLAWNALSLFISGVFYVLTEKDLFFYLLIIQLFLSLVFYPKRGMISKELDKDDIVFT